MAVAGDGIVDLSWKEPADGGTKITGFNIYRKEDSAKQWLLQTVTMDHYKDKTAKNGKVYTYQVSAVNKIGEGIMSEEAVATPGKAPDAPANVKLTIEDGEVTLSWDPPAKDGGFEVKEYKVYRGTSSSDMTEVGTMETTSYTDSDLEDGTTYYYKVSAVNDLGEGDGSSAVNIKVPEKKVEPNSPLGALNPMWLILVIVAVVCVVAVTGYMRHRNKGGDTPPPQQPGPEPPVPSPAPETPQQPYQEQPAYDQSTGQYDQSQGWDQGYDQNQQYYEQQQPPQQY